MKCPVDGTLLTMADRQGVEIDYCPSCRGVWLDRGELDKIAEMSAQPAPAPRPAARGDDRPAPRDSDSRPFGDDDRYGDDNDPRRRKRKSMLGDLFDF